MAKFVLAGKSDCPHYAKAELLADSLQRSLPDFRIHKISIPPDKWKEWLEDTCERNGWKHEESPVVWRELVSQGGRGLFLGGSNDFMEYCQDYYNITSDMPTEVMLSVAAENLEIKRNQTAEEELRASLIRPLHIWITGALSPSSSFLIPNLLSADVFPNALAISLHLLHLDGSEERLQQLRMETEDLALPLLHQVTVHTDLQEAFKQADVIILLDDGWSDDIDDDDDDEEEEAGDRVKMRKKGKGVSVRYTEYGKLINTNANAEVKVLVSGNSSANLRCSLLLDNAPSIDSCQFVAVATQLVNEARAIIAKRLGVRASDVTDVIVWGNINGTFYVDLQRARVFNYDGAVTAPAFFSQPVLNVLLERKWLETDFQEMVHSQRADVASRTCRETAMSITNGILTVLKAWNGLSGPDEVFSLGVLCQDFHNLPDGVVLSLPVTLAEGKWSALRDVTVGEELRERVEICASEIRKVCGVESHEGYSTALI